MSDGAVAVTLPPLASPTREVWQVLLNLAGLPGVEWTLIGGQMVLLHALEHGVSPPQVSQDGDVVGNVRSNQKTIKRIVAFLEADGFTLDGISPEGIAHRYVKQWEPADVKFDVLAPEGLSEGTDLSTTGSGRTIRVPGGTQALDVPNVCWSLTRAVKPSCLGQPCWLRSWARAPRAGSEGTSVATCATWRCFAAWSRTPSRWLRTWEGPTVGVFGWVMGFATTLTLPGHWSRRSSAGTASWPTRSSLPIRSSRARKPPDLPGRFSRMAPAQSATRSQTARA